MQKLKKDWKFFLILFLAVIMLLSISFYSLGISDKLYIKGEEINADKYIENISQGTIIEQKIISQNNNLERIDIEFEPFKDEYNIAKEAIIGIKNENGEIIAAKSVSFFESNTES